MRGQLKFYHWSITVYTGLSLVNFIIWRNFFGATSASATQSQPQNQGFLEIVAAAELNHASYT